jgi:peptide/nickel transport system substrate-binding protein
MTQPVGNPCGRKRPSARRHNLRTGCGRNRKVSRFAPLLLASSLVGCASSDAPAASHASDLPNEADRYGGTAVIAIGSVNLPLNPLGARYFARTVTRDLRFLPLIRYDSRGDPIPALAERWELTPAAGDSLSVTFHLRTDVRWHDGEPTTASDVIFTYARVLDPRYDHPSGSLFGDFHGAPERIGASTVRFRAREHPDLLRPFAEVPIAPRHLLHLEPLNDRPFTEFVRRPIGNGPFRFVRHVWSHELVLEANPNFPDGLGGRPYLDRLVFREGSNPYSIRANLMTGRFHLGSMLRDQADFSDDPPPGFRFVADPVSQTRWIVWHDDPVAPPASTRNGAVNRLLGVEPDGISIFGGAARWWLAPR